MDNQSGLIFSYILDGKGGGKPVDWNDINRLNPEHDI